MGLDEFLFIFISYLFVLWHCLVAEKMKEKIKEKLECKKEKKKVNGIVLGNYEF